ncbi:MAG: hypothetical protein AAFX02_10310, partial [Pseudomonadota bacterium]
IANDQITVADDGPGMLFNRRSEAYPDLNMVEQYLEYPHFGPSAYAHAPHVHMRAMGVGLACVNAASAWLKIKTDNGRQAWSKTYLGFTPQTAVTSPSSGITGTSISLKLEPHIFGRHVPNLRALRSELIDQAAQYPGLRVALNGEIFLSENGLLDLAETIHTKQFGPSRNKRKVRLELSHPFVKLQIALIGDAIGVEIQKSWANGVHTRDGGSHIEGLDQALQMFGWRPAVRLIHAIMMEPEYAGPTKDTLHVPQLTPIVRDLVTPEISRFLSNDNGT